MRTDSLFFVKDDSRPRFAAHGDSQPRLLPANLARPRNKSCRVRTATARFRAAAARDARRTWLPTPPLVAARKCLIEELPLRLSKAEIVMQVMPAAFQRPLSDELPILGIFQNHPFGLSIQL